MRAIAVHEVLAQYRPADFEPAEPVGRVEVPRSGTHYADSLGLDPIDRDSPFTEAITRRLIVVAEALVVKFVGPGLVITGNSAKPLTQTPITTNEIQV